MQRLLMIAAIVAFTLSTPTLADAKSEPVCKKGEKFEVEWKGKWYAAKALKTSKNGKQCYITYVGWSSSWDEWVTKDRIKR